jgi:2',3'-cyclic-nucleotide 2'-phosphodiesterase (5'-nucleotidase family)
MKLKILYINDLHSRFEEFAKIASVIEDLREENTLIFDAGDFYDPWRIEAIGTNGKISSDLLNEVGFNARVVGNTEGFSGKETLENMVKTSNFPIITCNMYDLKGEKFNTLKDYLIFEVGKLRTLVIGVTSAYNEFYNLYNIYIGEPIEELKRVLSNIEKSKYDMLIIISHLGINQDKILANAMPNIDIIIGGHSHTVLDDCIIENNTIICQAGQYGEYLGELVIEYNLEEKVIDNFKNKLILVRNYQEHPKINEILSESSKIAHENMSHCLFKIKRMLSHSFTEESELGNLLADGLKDFLKADIGIINSGLLNHGIENKNITKLILHEICPSPLNPTLIEIKGNDILLTLEKSLLKEFQLSNGAGGGFRGNFLGNIQISNNVRVIYNPTGKPLSKIKSVEVEGELLKPLKWYKVATSDYLQRGTGYTDFMNSKNEIYKPEWLREILEMYLKQKRFIQLAISKRFIKTNE